MAKSFLPADDVLLKEWPLVPGARVYEEDVLDFAHTILMRYGNYPETPDSSVATPVNEEATELVTLVSQTELSPRAQAVLAAIHAAPDNTRDSHRSSGAAAIRAAVDQVLPEEPLYGGDQRWMFERDVRQECRKKFFTIVTELEGQATPAFTEEEVAEIMTWLRSTRAADLLEQSQTVLVPVCERDLDSILSPSGGYELREGAALTEGAQLIGGEWWAPVFGCDSVEHTLNRIRQRLDPFQENGSLKSYQTFASSPVPVSHRLPQPEECDAEGRCWGFHPYNPEDDNVWTSWSLVPAKLLPSTRIWIGWDHWLPFNALPLPSSETET